jgi:hypothetical protein
MFKKVIHIIVACFILVSTTGFTINLHYCHNQIYDLALFAPAHSCCETGSQGHCHSTGDMAKMNHCEDESIIMESVDDFVGSSFAVNLENTHSIDLLLTASIIFNVEVADDEIDQEAPWHKEPPPYREVVLSQIQSYLI